MNALLPSPEALNRLSRLHLKRDGSGDAMPLGSQRGARPGSSREFLGLRPYEVGDDLRDLDWAATLRFDRPTLRLYRQEAESSLLLVLDASASMGSGAPTKWAYVQALACALGHIALGHADRVGAVAFNTSLLARLPLGRRPGQWRALRESVERLAPAGGADFHRIAAWLAPMRASHTVVVLLSDFLPPDAFADGLRRLARSPLRVVALQVVSPEDTAPTLDGECELIDCETGQTRTGWIGPAQRAAYVRALQSASAHLAGLCREAGIRHAQIPTDVPVVRCLQETLVRAGVLCRARS
ncbi:MAG TPA: DUF58 domain-containing protein [Candidatus Baltobacteraceae bacterium]|nr:DUF58 domain-containing protein [Candidatus Baltobacteraceae bacterium]